MNKTSIEWTHRPGSVGLTWNPIRAKFRDDAGNLLRGWACTHASTGCLHCYAETINKRFGTGLPFSVPALSRIEFYIDEKILTQPLEQKKPATIFVGDMFDLFHEAIPDDMIAKVMRMICETSHRHVFQVLTKRAQRMQGLLSQMDFFWPYSQERFPVENLWLGVSVENQQYADERIPLLLQTPASVRFLSVEPQLEAVNLKQVDYRWQLRDVHEKYLLHEGHSLEEAKAIALKNVPEGDFSNDEGSPYLDVLTGEWFDGWDRGSDGAKVDWVIAGGESGPGARPFDLAWAEYLLKQCRAAGVPFFMKQLGSNPQWPNDYWAGLKPPKLSDRKGGSMEDWPNHLRVREFPSFAEGSAKGKSVLGSEEFSSTDLRIR